jgi:hypothetical protein
MKNIFTLIATVLVSTFLTAGIPEMNVKVSGKSIVVNLIEAIGQKVTIKIKDANNNVLSKKNVKEETESIVFILHDLNDGIYSIELKDEVKISEQTIIINEGKVYLDQKIESTFIPSIDIRKGYIKVNMMAKNSPVNVTISDTKGNKVFEDNFTGVKVEKILDTRNLGFGNYFLNIKVDDKSFSYAINK